MIAAILMSCCTGVAFAQNFVDNTPYTITFQQEDSAVSYSAGEIIPVEVVLSENPGFDSPQLVFSFNKDLLQYMGPVTYSDMFPASKYNDALFAGRIDPTQSGYGMLGSLGMLDASLVAVGGRLITVGFKVLDDTADPSEYSITTSTSDRFSMGSISSDYADTTNYPNATIIPCTLNVGSSSGIESVTLDKEKLTLPVGSTATLTATVFPEDATNKNVTWASDNEEVATVADGVVTAVAGGTANITATTEDGGHTATCEVTVNAKQPEVKNGYTVSLPDGTTTVQPGEAVNMDVTVGVGTEDTATTYNAVDMTIAYDAEKLTFDQAASTLYTASVTDANGTLSLKRYGEDMTIGTDKVSLKFTANSDANGEAAVTITSAHVDQADKAEQDAPEAAILNATHKISIEGGYKVTITTSPENLNEVSGAATAQKGEDYSFTLNPLANYDYAVTATVGGAEVPCTLDGTTYTIPAGNVTGDIAITVTRTARQYNVTLDGTGAGDAALSADKAAYGTDYTFAVTQNADYSYTVSAKVGDETLSLTSTSEGNVYTYTIPGDKITGDVTVTVDREKKTTPPVPTTFSVTWEGDALDDVPTQAATAEQAKDFSFTVNKQAGYTYEVSATMAGTPATINEADGAYTIAHVAGDLVITVNRTAVSTLTVDVAEYVKQDAKTVYLITAADSALAEGKLLAYDGANMFHSAKYDAYCYLVISTESAETVKTDAEAKIAQADGTAIEIGNTGDVNGTGKIDINDAQMAYNMYGSELYNDFEKATMKMYLEADVSGDKKVDVSDAAAIVNLIK